jgi:prevent-host-death family protein
MKVMTASEVSRAFSAVLDEAERGETIVITRSGRRVATISAASPATWGALRTALADWLPVSDPDLEGDVRSAREAVTLDEDPWQNG